MHIVRMEYPADDFLDLVEATRQHELWVQAEYTADRRLHAQEAGSVALLQVAESGEIIRPGITINSKVRVRDSIELQHIQRGSENDAEREAILNKRLQLQFDPVEVGNGHVGIAYIFDSRATMDAIRTRARELHVERIQQATSLAQDEASMVPVGSPRGLSYAEMVASNG